MVLLATTALPVVGLTVLAATVRLGGTLPGGPLPETFFANLGPLRSSLVPLLLVTLGLVGFALRERSAGYAFSAGLVLELAVTLGYTLWTLTAKLPFDASFFVTLAQLAIIAAAGWAILWLAARRRLKPPGDTSADDLPWLTLQVAMPAGGNIVLLALTVFQLVQAPANLPAWSAGLASLPGWIGLLSAAVAAGWYVRTWKKTTSLLHRGTVPFSSDENWDSPLLHVLVCLLLGVGVLAACHAGRLEMPAAGVSWLAYHVLTIAWASAAVVSLGLVMLAEKVGPRATRLLNAPGWTRRSNGPPSARWSRDGLRGSVRRPWRWRSCIRSTIRCGLGGRSVRRCPSAWPPAWLPYGCAGPPMFTFPACC